MADTELLLDGDGYLDMDQFDDEPLGFLDRRSADRILRTGLDAGLTDDWQSRLDAASGWAAQPTAVTDEAEAELLPLAAREPSRSSRFGAPVLRLAAAAAAVGAVVLGLQALLDDPAPQDPAITPTTTAPVITTTAAPTSTDPSTTSTPASTTTEPESDDPVEVGTTPSTTAPAPSTTPTTATTTTTTTTTVPVTLAVTGPATANPLQTLTYTATGSGFSSAQWSVSGPCTLVSSGPMTADVLLEPPGGSCAVVASAVGALASDTLMVAVAAPTIAISGPTQAQLGEVITVTATGIGWTEVFWAGGPLCGVISSSGATAELQCSASMTGPTDVFATARYQGQTVMVGGSSVQAGHSLTVVDPSG